MGKIECEVCGKDVCAGIQNPDKCWVPESTVDYEDVHENCLSKQRVREVLNKYIKKTEELNELNFKRIFETLFKDLGLSQ